VGRSFRQLAGPLVFGQKAPLLFLWASKLSVLMFGATEYALRLVPLLAGMLLPVLVWRVATRAVGREGAAVAAMLSSLSLVLVYYTQELKPYGVDAFITVALLLAATSVIDAPAASRRWLGLGLLGAVGMVCSFPVPFVLAGVGTSLVLLPAAKRPSRWLLRVGLLGGFWMAVFLVLYFISYRFAAQDRALQRFWEGTYLSPGAPDLAFRWTRAAQAMFVFPAPAMWRELPWQVPALGFPLGIWGLVRANGWARGSLIGVPLLATLLAAVTGHYPIGQRLLLFLAPCIFIALAGIVPAAQSAIPSSPRAGSVVAALACLGVAAGAAPPLWHFLTGSRPVWQARSLVRSVPGDVPVYVLALGLPRWLFYSTNWSAPTSERVRWLSAIGSAGGPAEANAPSRGRGIQSEGDSLVEHRSGRPEVIGIPMGIEFRLPRGHQQAMPDAGWADNEARRMQAVATPYVWVFASQYLGHWLTDLFDGIRRRGGEIAEARIQDGPLRTSPVGNGWFERAAVYRIRFPKGPD
jgi:hypothetical protein